MYLIRDVKKNVKKRVSELTVMYMPGVGLVPRGRGTNKSGIQFLASSSLPVRIDETATETNTVSAPMLVGLGEDRWKEGRMVGKGSEV